MRFTSQRVLPGMDTRQNPVAFVFWREVEDLDILIYNLYLNPSLKGSKANNTEIPRDWPGLGPRPLPLFCSTGESDAMSMQE
jgi:hypothetical protein